MRAVNEYDVEGRGIDNAKSNTWHDVSSEGGSHASLDNLHQSNCDGSTQKKEKEKEEPLPNSGVNWQGKKKMDSAEEVERMFPVLNSSMYYPLASSSVGSQKKLNTYGDASSNSPWRGKLEASSAKAVNSLITKETHVESGKSGLDSVLKKSKSLKTHGDRYLWKGHVIVFRRPEYAVNIYGLPIFGCRDGLYTIVRFNEDSNAVQKLKESINVELNQRQKLVVEYKNAVGDSAVIESRKCDKKEKRG